MKKTILIALIITINILSTSCSKNDENTNLYQGNWSGNLNGDIVGTWSGNVSSSGKLNGKVITTQSSPDHDFILVGQINDNGNLIATMKNIKYNISLDCIGSFQNTLFNGTWIFNGAGMEGTWNGTKE
jgi:hypothetical protein